MLNVRGEVVKIKTVGFSANGKKEVFYETGEQISRFVEFHDFSGNVCGDWDSFLHTAERDAEYCDVFDRGIAHGDGGHQHPHKQEQHCGHSEYRHRAFGDLRRLAFYQGGADYIRCDDHSQGPDEPAEFSEIQNGSGGSFGSNHDGCRYTRDLQQLAGCVVPCSGRDSDYKRNSDPGQQCHKEMKLRESGGEALWRSDRFSGESFLFGRGIL